MKYTNHLIRTALLLTLTLIALPVTAALDVNSLTPMEQKVYVQVKPDLKKKGLEIESMTMKSVSGAYKFQMDVVVTEDRFVVTVMDTNYTTGVTDYYIDTVVQKGDKSFVTGYYNNMRDMVSISKVMIEGETLQQIRDKISRGDNKFVLIKPSDAQFAQLTAVIKRRAQMLRDLIAKNGEYTRVGSPEINEFSYLQEESRKANEAYNVMLSEFDYELNALSRSLTKEINNQLRTRRFSSNEEADRVVSELTAQRDMKVAERRAEAKIELEQAEMRAEIADAKFEKVRHLKDEYFKAPRAFPELERLEKIAQRYRVDIAQR